MLVESEVDPGLAQVRVIESVESVELVCILFCRAVASEQMPAEVDAHLGNHRRTVFMVCRSQFNACHQVFLSVCAELPDRKLRPGENDGFRQVLEHERQGRRRV